jgi:hypothetical protein
MVLKTKVTLSQSKKAWTQYLTIPSAVVQDSQYPFKPDEELYLEIEPTTHIMIISGFEKPLEIKKEGLLVKRSKEEELLQEAAPKGIEQEAG